MDSHDSYGSAYADYLRSDSIPACLEDDIRRLEQVSPPQDYDEPTEDLNGDVEEHQRPVDDWMLICQRQPDLSSAQGDDEQVDWCAAANAYPRLEEAPFFVARNKETFEVEPLHTNTADPEKLQGKQRQVYQVVEEHLQQLDAQLLRLIVSGTAGTGNSYLIHCLKQLLKQKLWVAATTGVAAFNIKGCTLHSLLDLPTRSELKSCAGLTFVACSRVRRLTDLIFEPPFDYDRVQSLGSTQRVHERRLEDVRLRLVEHSTITHTPADSRRCTNDGFA